jgi:uncharacterized protein YdeI (YjbR/CyaY-like superfamily)
MTILWRTAIYASIGYWAVVASGAEKARAFRNRGEWRRWLEKNHEKVDWLWLFISKKHAEKCGIRYDEALEEAICFGWIDGKLKRVDEETFLLRFSPRKPGSVWSRLNRTRAETMIQQEKMTEAGLKKISEAKSNGRWDSAYTSRKTPSLPEDLKEALEKDAKARDNFHCLSNSHQMQYLFWLEGARRKETRENRIEEIVRRARDGIKPGVR